MSIFFSPKVDRVLKSKLSSARKRLEKDKDVYLDKEHEEMCIHYKMYLDLMKQIKMKLKLITFDYYKDNIDDSKHISSLKSLIESNSSHVNFTKSEFDLHINYNEYNHKFINRLHKYLDVDYISDFIKEQSEFLKTLSVREIYNLKHYTNVGDTIIVSFITGTFDKKLLLSKEFHKLAIFHFQFQDYFRENPVFNDATIDTENFENFFKFIKSNYMKFTSDIYNYIFNLYIKELNDIFKKAPKTKKILYVYRAVRDNYIAAEVIKNKTIGYYISNRFTSTSLFSNNSMAFMDDDYKGILYEIKIEKNLPVIFLEGITFHSREYEVLLPINAKFYIDYANKKEKYYHNFNLICEDTGKENYSDINMTSLVYFDL